MSALLPHWLILFIQEYFFISHSANWLLDFNTAFLEWKKKKKERKLKFSAFLLTISPQFSYMCVQGRVNLSIKLFML